MDYNEIPRGHIPTIILTTLFDGDKYGNEIIKSIEDKTNGKISIKQASLYSSLRRLEDQDLISSYWLDSDIGGKRHYYRLTDMGRKQANEWQKQIIDNQESIKTAINDNNNEISIKDEDSFKNHNEILNDNDTTKDNNDYSTTVIEQVNFFDVNNSFSLNECDSNSNNENPSSQDNFSFFDDNIFSNEQIKQETINDNARLTNEDVEPSFNVKSELNKYIKERKSFVDSLKDSDETYSPKITSSTLITDNEKEKVFEDNAKEEIVKPLYTQEDIDRFFNNNYVGKQNTQVDSPNVQEQIKDHETKQEKDDAIFITEKTDPEKIPKVKKIEPADFEYISNGHLSTIKSPINVMNNTRTVNSTAIQDETIEITENTSYVKEDYNTEKQNKPVVQEITTNSNFTYETDITQIKNVYITKNQTSIKTNETTNNYLQSRLNRKSNIISNLITYAIILIELLIFNVVLKNDGILPYLAYALLSSFPLICSLFTINTFKFNYKRLFVFLEANAIILVFILFIINLAFGMNFSNIASYAFSFSMPSICLLTLPVSSLLQYLLYKKNNG